MPNALDSETTLVGYVGYRISYTALDVNVFTFYFLCSRFQQRHGFQLQNVASGKPVGITLNQ
jgi:hypothetical protein